METYHRTVGPEGVFFWPGHEPGGPPGAGQRQQPPQLSRNCNDQNREVVTYQYKHTGAWNFLASECILSQRSLCLQPRHCGIHKVCLQNLGPSGPPCDFQGPGAELTRSSLSGHPAHLGEWRVWVPSTVRLPLSICSSKPCAWCLTGLTTESASFHRAGWKPSHWAPRSMQES